MALRFSASGRASSSSILVSPLRQIWQDCIGFQAERSALLIDVFERGFDHLCGSGMTQLTARILFPALADVFQYASLSDTRQACRRQAKRRRR